MVSVGFSFSEVLDLSLYQFKILGTACLKVEGRRRAEHTTDLVNAIQISFGGEESDLREYCASLMET